MRLVIYAFFRVGYLGQNVAYALTSRFVKGYLG
jgi:hypothetical protein